MMTAEQLAQQFHETYERLAPQFGYATRKESAKPWDEVPEQNRKLMTAVCAEVLSDAAAQLAEKEREMQNEIADNASMMADIDQAWHALGMHDYEGENPLDYFITPLRLRAEAAEERLKEAQAWKESQLKVTPDWQKIGELLNVGLGQSVTENIIPAITDLRERLRQREAELEQRWIAVGERLPDVGRRVCVSVSHSGYKTRTMGLWTGESWKIASLEKEQGQLAATIEGTITHWQRIPAPPK